MSIDEAGNRLIRELEPPAHDKWKQELDEVNGACTFKEVNDFVRDCLREFAQKPGADSQQFKGLNKYLGFSTERDDLNVGANRGEHDGHKKADVETAVEVGATTEHELATEISLPSAKKMVTVSSAARGDDTQRGGIVNRRNETHTDGASDTEEGKFPRMDMSAVEFYSVAKKTDSGYTYQITLSPSEDVDGAVQLLAIGDGANYSVKIASASLESGVSIKTSGSTLVGLALKAGTPTRYNITLEGGKRYTLGVEDNGR
jgi:hypothetical protein